MHNSNNEVLLLTFERAKELLYHYPTRFHL